MPDSPDIKSFRRHFHLAEKLIARSSKAEIAEVARLLAINCAHYQSKYGEQLLEPTIGIANSDRPDAKTAKVLNRGMQNLCAIMAIVIGDTDPSSPEH